MAKAKSTATKKSKPMKFEKTQVDRAEEPAGLRKEKGEEVMAAKHPALTPVQAGIAKKEGVSKKATGAILASATRKASAKAKAKNPRLINVTHGAAAAREMKLMEKQAKRK